MNVNFASVNKGKCVVDGRPLRAPHTVVCLKCMKPCEVRRPVRAKIGDSGGAKVFIMDAKSSCCGADVQSAGSLTCCRWCHERFVAEMERQFGIYKRVIDGETKAAYRVPVRFIVENGLTRDMLPMFPRDEGGVA